LDLRDADLRGADLRGAKLAAATLAAWLSRAQLDGANLSGADLTDAEGVTEQQLATAITDESTQFPAHLDAAARDEDIPNRRCDGKVRS
jgi:uncharacterized protein YjbI with pentapeptide repeats